MGHGDLESSLRKRTYRGLSFHQLFPRAESFLCTMGWHQSVGTIIFPGACSICFSLFSSSCLPKKKEEFSTAHSLSLSKQLNYSDKIPLI